MPRSFIVLAPKAIHEEVIDLNSYYIDPNKGRNIERDTTQIRNLRKWIPGEYTIQCWYKYEHKPSFTGGKDLWRGLATSNMITLSIETDESDGD